VRRRVQQWQLLGRIEDYQSLNSAEPYRRAPQLQIQSVTTQRPNRFNQQITADLTGAYFERGSLACLTQGSPVELKGYTDSTGKFVVVRVELEGACGSSSSSSDNSSSGGSVFVEAEGAITELGTNQFTLSVYEIENYTGARLTSVTVTYDSSTIFKHVTPTGLRTGMFVEVKGTLTGSTLKATKVELD
jgi:hypothetical protein